MEENLSRSESNRVRQSKKSKSRLYTYPQNFETKVGYTEVMYLITKYCTNAIGKELIHNLHATADVVAIKHRLQRVQEMISLLQEYPNLLVLSITDLRLALKRIATNGSSLEEDELPLLLHAITAFLSVVRVVGQKSDSDEWRYPALCKIPASSEGLQTVSNSIAILLDKSGRIKSTASSLLAQIRSEQSIVQQQIGNQMRRLMEEAVKNGFVTAESQPSLRDGRPVIPVISAHKRSIPGIVHDESATGKTLFIEPLEVVQSNNRLRELEAEERREIRRILQDLTTEIRPFVCNIEQMYLSLGRLDAVAAIARFAIEEKASVPEIHPRPCMDWQLAVHPLLRKALSSDKKEVVPLSIRLKYPNERILVVSGPNAGGKSVCLKTVGLLQYMLQCGLPVPMSPDSKVGVFDHIALDIGDDQSIEDDLSTYSSHLKHMKYMAAVSGRSTLLLIDEFGGGTEPEIGGAIAEGLLKLFNERGAWGVITTHYRNLKEFAETQPGVINGAMLYDKEHFRPLFSLSVGHPGSSFAVEIARKQGLPAVVLKYASEKVGLELVQSDKYVQDIARNKQLWDHKRVEIERREKQLDATIEVYEQKLRSLREKHNDIIERAKKEAAELLNNSRARIERTIKEIVESKAEKEQTKLSRKELLQYAQDLQEQELQTQQNLTIDREIEKLQRRARRKEEKQQKNKETEKSPEIDLSPSLPQPLLLREGDSVLIVSRGIRGTIISLNAKEAVVALSGNLKVTCKTSDLQPLSGQEHKKENWMQKPQSNLIEHIREKRADFRQELDVRGMRALEAEQAVQYFIDDAVALGIGNVRILHGTGTGALRQSIRQLLPTIPGVASFHDEDVRFGGAGITVVHLE